MSAEAQSEPVPVPSSKPPVAVKVVISIIVFVHPLAIMLHVLAGGGPFVLKLGVQENRLVFQIAHETGEAHATHVLSLTPLKRVIRDYFVVCDTYYQAIRSAAPSQIEAIDMGRRGLHDEGSQLLRDRLTGKIAVDHDTARRLFTLICALHIKV